MMSLWKQKMDAGRGLAELDMVLKHANLVNVFSGEIHETDIGISDGKFVGIGEFNLAKTIIDLTDKYVVPGLIDGHVHIESSQLCPEEFFSLLLAHGVTTAVVDPHEIANVMGVEGIRYILDSIASIPANAYVALPSCVPATHLETSGAKLDAVDLKEFLSNPKVIGLGEIMDFPSVLDAKPEMVAKLELPVNFLDGHAPGISPQDLNAYYLAGIHTEHECSTPYEALERLRRGFYVMLREGSAAKNLLDLLPVVTPENSGQCLLVTDDRHPTDLLNEGSIDHLVRLAIRSGQPPVRVVQMATINAARALGLEGIGAVAPGFQADFVVLDDLEKFTIQDVYCKGINLSSKGKRPLFEHKETSGLTDSVHIGKWQKEKLKVSFNNSHLENKIETEDIDAGKYLKPIYCDSSVKEHKHMARVRVIGIQSHSLVTSSLTFELPVIDGLIIPDSAQNVAKIAVLERHHNKGNVGLGFVHGLGLKKGAIASTIAHDSHNLVVVGMSDEEMDLAIRTCTAMGGGQCVVEGDQVLGKLSLPIAGLMTEEQPEIVAEQLLQLHEKARVLGMSKNVDPFMNLAFLSLPVIPELKITDLGLVDVEKLRLTELIL